MIDLANSSEETILVVEDEAFVRDVTCEILRSAGHKVRTATNASEAESIFFGFKHQVALLLTDIVLPGDSGRVLAERLCRVSPALRVLFMTGYAEQMDVDPRHPWSCLAKPFAAATLLRQVESLLGHPDFKFSGHDISAMPVCGNAEPGEYVQERQAAAQFG